MATGYQPLVEEDDWETVPSIPKTYPLFSSPSRGVEGPLRVVSDDIENLVIIEKEEEPIPDPQQSVEDEELLIQYEEEEEETEDGPKGVADVDYLPIKDNEIPMIRGVIIL